MFVCNKLNSHVELNRRTVGLLLAATGEYTTQFVLLVALSSSGEIGRPLPAFSS